MKTHDQALADQQGRAVQLVRERSCPHCHKPISLLDALSVVRGHGQTYHVKIKLPDGSTTYIRERDFNPQTMLWAGEIGQAEPAPERPQGLSSSTASR